MEETSGSRFEWYFKNNLLLDKFASLLYFIIVLNMFLIKNKIIVLNIKLHNIINKKIIYISYTAKHHTISNPDSKFHMSRSSHMWNTSHVQNPSNTIY